MENGQGSENSRGNVRKMNSGIKNIRAALRRNFDVIC